MTHDLTRWRLLAPLLLAGALCGCSEGDGRMPLIVYSPHGPDILEEFEEMFEAEHPEVDVQSIRGSPGTILTRVRGEAPNPRGDVWWGAPITTLSRAADEGLLRPYRPKWADKVDPSHLDPEDRFAGQFLMAQVILYNRDRVTPEDAPRDWDDLVSAKWQDRVLIRYPMESGSMRGAFSWIMAWKTEGEDFEPGYDFLRALHQNTKSYLVNPTEFFKAIKQDRAGAAGIWNLTDCYFQRDRYQYPFGVVIPESGVPLVVDGIALIDKPDDPPGRAKMAEAFYDFVTDMEATRYLMREHYRVPTRTDVAPEDQPEWMRGLELNPLPTAPERAAAHEDEWMRYWDAEIKPLKKGNG